MTETDKNQPTAEARDPANFYDFGPFEPKPEGYYDHMLTPETLAWTKERRIRLAAERAAGAVPSEPNGR